MRANEALAFFPDDYALNGLLAYAYLINGQNEKAQETIEVASKLNPADMDIREIQKKNQ